MIKYFKSFKYPQIILNNKKITIIKLPQNLMTDTNTQKKKKYMILKSIYFCSTQNL